MPITNGLTRTLRALEELRKLDPEMPANQAAAFLVIAKEEGLTQLEVGKRVDGSKSGVQRTFDKLGEKGINGKPGLAVIEVREGGDRRERLAFLTPKGRRVADALRNLMED